MWGNWCIKKNGYLNVILYKSHLNHGYLMKNPHGNHQHQHAPRRPMAVANQRISALPWPPFFWPSCDYVMRIQYVYLYSFCSVNTTICLHIYIYVYTFIVIVVMIIIMHIYIYIHTLFIYFIMLTIISVYIIPMNIHGRGSCQPFYRHKIVFTIKWLGTAYKMNGPNPNQNTIFWGGLTPKHLEITIKSL